MRFVILLLVVLMSVSESSEAQKSAEQLVTEAIEYLRGTSSYAEASMTVHREDWSRSMSMTMWTEGRERSLVRFTAPKKDAGNASLTVDDSIWSYAPKINRVIKIPPSMMSQSWMGSDFSYQDLSKADDIIDDYTHALVGEEKNEGKTVYVIESIPKESAPVVWGKERLKVREDFIILQRMFYDQDYKLVKQLQAGQIREISGKLYATRIRMENLEEQGSWTEVEYSTIEFGRPIPDNIFTISNLKNPRR